jgi:hypothetical protein
MTSGADPGDELFGAEGLGHVVVRTELEPDDPVRLIRACGQHDDRHRRLPAQRPCHVEAVETGQPQVEDHEIGMPGARLAQRRRAVARGGHREAGALEVVARQANDVGLVIDDEDRLHLQPRSLRK